MLRSPERPPPQNIAFSYSASSIFSKSGRFIQGNEGYQIVPFVVGPPFRPAFRASSLRGGGPKFLKICSKIHFLSNSRCNAGPDFWFKLIQIEASSLLGVSLAPLCGQNSIALASWGVVRCHTHTSIRTSRLEGRRAGRCILRRRDSRCVVS